MVPASTTLLSRSEAGRSFNLNYVFFRFPRFSTTPYQSTFQNTNYLQQTPSTTPLPPQEQVYNEDALQFSVLNDNPGFEPLFENYIFEDQKNVPYAPNEKRSVEIPENFKVFEAVPFGHQQWITQRKAQELRISEVNLEVQIVRDVKCEK